MKNSWTYLLYIDVRKVLLLSFFILSLFFTHAQHFINPFGNVKKEKELLYGFDNRRTHIQEQSVLIMGLYTGIGFGGVLRLKLGISGNPLEVGRLENEFGLTQKNRMLFLTIGEEFDFYINNRIRSTIYLQGGWGYNYYRMIDSEKIEVSREKQPIVPIELGLQGSYDIYSWLRFKLGAGWRFVLPSEADYLAGYYLKIGFSVNSKKLYQAYKVRKSTSE